MKKKQSPPVSYTEARANLAKLIAAAAEGKPVIIRRRGYPEVVLIQHNEYRDLVFARDVHEGHWPPGANNA